MEQNLPVITKRVCNIVRAVLFMMRKGFLSKKKLMLDLNMALKRGKIASAKAIGNLMFHHHRQRQVSPSSFTPVSKAAAAAASVQEYEFSCSNTPSYTFPFSFNHKKKSGSTNNYYHHLFACVHAPPTHDDDNLATMNAVKVVLEMLNNNDMEGVVAASPMLPGFGQTPLARQLRVTDSPFPLRDADEDNSYVDRAAEDFISRFYKDLKQQNKTLSEF